MLQRAYGNRAVQRLLVANGPQKEGGQTKPIASVIQRNVADNIRDFKKDHPAWQSVMEGINPTASDEEMLDQLVANFKDNRMGFKYTGPGKTYDLNGDCGSLARTFVDIATNFLEIKGVKTAYFNGGKGNGWYLEQGFHEIDPARGPNVSNGYYYFKTSHVWVDWNGIVYDVLFGEKGQNGQEADDGKTVRGTWYFKIDKQWFKSQGRNKYVKARRFFGRFW
jgi:hypothetical protein